MKSPTEQEHTSRAGTAAAAATDGGHSLLRAVGIFALAAALRLHYLGEASANPMFWAPEMDARYHDEWARRLAAGDWIGQQAFFRAPLYPYFLGLIYALFGPGYLAPRVIQALIGSASCVLVALLGRRVAGPGVGIAAGLICALYGPLIFFDGELLLPVLEVFLGVAGLLALQAARERPTGWRWLGAGVLLGLFAITRPNILLFALFAVGACAWRCRRLPRRGIAQVGILAAGILLPIFPVTARNWVVSGDFVPIASQAGVNLYIGNNPQSDGTSAVVPGTRATWWGGYHDTIRIAEAHEGRSLKASEVSAYWTRRTLEEVRDDPGHWLALMARKSVLFWHGFELPNNDVLYCARWESPLLRLLLWTRQGLSFPFGVLAPLALLGMAVGLKRRREWALLYGFLILYAASVVLFFVCDRYRMPVVPALAIFAAYAVGWLFARARERAWRPFAAALFGLALLGWGVNADPYGVDRVDEAKGHCDRGGAWRNLGHWRRCEAEYRKALAVGATQEALYLGAVANACLMTGRVDEAERLCRQAMALAPQDPNPHLILAGVHERRGDAEKARAENEAALALDPYAVEALAPLAKDAVQAGRLEDAARLYEQIAQAQPENVEAFAKLGECRQQMGDFEGAARAYDRALAIDAGAWQTRLALASCYAAAGRGPEALAEYERVVAGGGAQSGVAWFFLGMGYEFSRRPAEAVRAFERSLALDPQGEIAMDARRHLARVKGTPHGTER